MIFYELRDALEEANHLCDQTLVQVLVMAACYQFGTVWKDSPSDGLNQYYPNSEK